MGISAFKPRDYGVLGLANELGKPVLFNFQNGKLYKYDNGKFIKLETEEYNGKYVYVLKNYRKELTPIETARDVMIAVPIAANGKLLGGVTFDMHIGAKTIYQNVDENDSEKIKAQKKQNNIKVMQEVVRTANNLIDAYFKKKGENI